VSSVYPGLDHVIWLNSGEPARSCVGGKAASLSRLVALGAPVPTAFAISTAAYAEFSDFHGFPRRVADVAAEHIEQLRTNILEAPFPVPIADSIRDAFHALARLAGDDLRLAVRSSATAEDSAAFSFAGLHDTVLDVRTLTALEAAIRRCWASLWSDRAVSYRRDGGLAEDISDIAVVVQQLIHSDVSFVAFAVDPVSGDQDTVVIDATWGLGESIVSGMVVPDHISVARDGRVLDYTVGSKHLMVIPGEHPGGGVREVPVPRLLQQIPALTPEQAQAIAGLARDLSTRLGYAADLEGGIVDGNLHLFQARPITTLAH
jgi:rifampicin phosphotransferase